MVLANYVELQPGVPTRMHFSDSYFIERLIYDRETKGKKTIRSLVFWVDRLGGEPSARTFSILSQKLASQLQPYLEKEQFKNWEFIITKEGEGFGTEYQVETKPYSPV